MKKVLCALAILFALSSCTGRQAVEKVDEKGHNPSPEQIIEVNTLVQVADTISLEKVDTLAQ